VGAFTRIGIRDVTGMSEIDNVVGTGLDPSSLRFQIEDLRVKIGAPID
jgi:hypothetical protein